MWTEADVMKTVSYLCKSKGEAIPVAGLGGDEAPTFAGQTAMALSDFRFSR
jgi:hypothetical protein